MLTWQSVAVIISGNSYTQRHWLVHAQSTPLGMVLSACLETAAWYMASQMISRIPVWVHRVNPVNSGSNVSQEVLSWFKTCAASSYGTKTTKMFIFCCDSVHGVRQRFLWLLYWKHLKEYTLYRFMLNWLLYSTNGLCIIYKPEITVL